MTLRQATGQMDGTTVPISTTASLPNLLITLKIIEFQKVSLSDMKNLKAVC